MFGPLSRFALLTVGASLLGGPQARAASTVVYLNFDGAQLTAPASGKGDHAAQGVSELVRRVNKKTLNVPAAKFPSDSPRDIAIKVLIADVRNHYHGLDIKWVTQKPIDDRYSMVVIGGSSELLGIKERELGWGPTDCGNQNPRNVAFVFSETITAQTGQWNSTQVAATISQEIAHALGLEHVEGPDDLLMRPVPAIVGSYRFADTCQKIVPGPVIGPNDELGCGVSPGCPKGQQNDRAALKAILGTKVEALPGGTTGAATSAPAGTDTGGSGAGPSGSTCSLAPGASPLWLWALVGAGAFARRRRRAKLAGS